jgi:APA family basic amino acid/polyamine antiporter
LLGSWHGGAAIMDFMLRLTAVSGVWIYAFAGLAALSLRLRPVLAGLTVLFSAGVMIGSGLEATVLSVVLLATALPLFWLTRTGGYGAALSTAAIDRR